MGVREQWNSANEAGCNPCSGGIWNDCKGKENVEYEARHNPLERIC